MKIHLHIGVHKTATTYIQNALRDNRQALSKAGVGYMGLLKQREFFTHRLMDFDPKSFRIEDHLGRFFVNEPPDSPTGLILSDENFIGYCASLLNVGDAFSTAEPRLGHIEELFRDHEVTLFCAVRSYDTFLASAYCEGLRNNCEINRKFIRFEEMRSRLKWERMRWHNIIDRFIDHLRPEKALIWRYEDFRANSEQIIDALTFGVRIQAKTSGDGIERPSFSQTAVDILQEVAEKHGRNVAGKLVFPVGDNLPKASGYPQFDPWTKEERTQLRQQYVEDCDYIDPSLWMLNKKSETKSDTVE